MARRSVGTAAGLTNSVINNPVGTAAGLTRKGVATGRTLTRGSANTLNRATRTAAEVAPYAATAASIFSPLP